MILQRAVCIHIVAGQIHTMCICYSNGASVGHLSESGKIFSCSS